VLDRSSRSTQALVKILAAQRWQIAPEFTEADPDPTAMLADSDAALVIGDLALRIAIAAEARGVKPGPDHEWLAPTATLSDSLVGAQYIAPAERPRQASTAAPLHIYDIVKEWWHLTEKPAVLAVWAAHTQSFPGNAVPAELTADFQASRDFGFAHLPEICSEAAREMQLPEEELRLYLEKNIDYTLDPENFQGLQRFWYLSSTLGITGPLQPMAIAAGPTTPARYMDFTYAQKRA
jgi:chorismate dehydratase